MLKLFLIFSSSLLLLYSFFAKAQDIPPSLPAISQPISVPLNEFIRSNNSNVYYWPSISNPILSISASENLIFLGNSIQTTSTILMGTANSFEVAIHMSVFPGELSVIVNVAVTPETGGQPGVPGTEGQYYAYCQASPFINYTTADNPSQVHDGDSLTLKTTNSGASGGGIRCNSYGFGKASFTFSNIMYTPISNTPDLALGPITIPEAKLDPSDSLPVIPANTRTLINVPVSINYNARTPLTPAELSTFVLVTLQAGSQTLTQNISIANLVASGNRLIVPFMLTLEPIDVGLKTLTATVNASQTFKESNFADNEARQKVHVVDNKYKIKKTISVVKGTSLIPVGNPDLFQMIPTIDTINNNNGAVKPKDRCSPIYQPSRVRIKVECQNDTAISDNIEGCKIQMQKKLGDFWGEHLLLSDNPHSIITRPLGDFENGIDNIFHEIPLEGLSFDYEAPEPAGEIDLNFIAMGPDDKVFVVPKSTAQVKVDNLVSLAGVHYLTMIDTGHKDENNNEAGVYATSRYRTQIQVALDTYYKKSLKEGIPENQIVLLTSEAASLIWGGLYDIKFNWHPSHCGHRKGDALDIGMANFNFSSSPHVTRMKKILEESLIDNKLYFPVPSESPSGKKHWHTQLK